MRKQVYMRRGRRVSAFVSDEVREGLERYVRQTGVKKGHLIEQALWHELQAVRELPADAIVATHVVLTPGSWTDVMRRLGSPPRPTKRLKKLMRSSARR